MSLHTIRTQTKPASKVRDVEEEAAASGVVFIIGLVSFGVLGGIFGWAFDQLFL